MKGLVIGKFLPPHDGHRQLWDFAAASCDELTIVVEHIAGESIPSATRVAWVRELAPRARVVHLDRSMPQQPSEHDDFWGLWCDTLAALAGRPDLLFASEAYGAPLARGLGCTFVPVDPARLGVAISATEVRTDPHAVWRYLPPPVRAHYTRRIAVVGPESSGKTTLSRSLKSRDGKVYIDCLQNGHGRLIVSPYSVRPKPGAPVSTPLEWDEITDDFDQRRFTIRTVLERLEGTEGDPCRPVLTTVPDIPRTLSLLSERLELG